MTHNILKTETAGRSTNPDFTPIQSLTVSRNPSLS